MLKGGNTKLCSVMNFYVILKCSKLKYRHICIYIYIHTQNTYIYDIYI